MEANENEWLNYKRWKENHLKKLKYRAKTTHELSCSSPNNNYNIHYQSNNLKI